MVSPDVCVGRSWQVPCSEAARVQAQSRPVKPAPQLVGSFAVDDDPDSDATDADVANDPEAFPASFSTYEWDPTTVLDNLTHDHSVVQFQLFPGLPLDLPISLAAMYEHVEALFKLYPIDGRDWNWIMNFTIGLHDKTPREPLDLETLVGLPCQTGACCAHVFVFLEVVGPPSLGSSMAARTVWTLAHADTRRRIFRLNIFNRELRNTIDAVRLWCRQPNSAFLDWKVRVDGASFRYSGDVAASGRSALGTMQYYLEHRSRTGYIVTSRLPARVRGYRPLGDDD